MNVRNSSIEQDVQVQSGLDSEVAEHIDRVRVGFHSLLDVYISVFQSRTPIEEHVRQVLAHLIVLLLVLSWMYITGGCLKPRKSLPETLGLALAFDRAKKFMGAVN